MNRKNEKAVSCRKRHIGRKENNSRSWVVVLVGIFLPPPLWSTHRTARVTALLPWRLTPSNTTSGACVCVRASVTVRCFARRGVYTSCMLGGCCQVTQSHITSCNISGLFGIYHCTGFCVHEIVCERVEEGGVDWTAACSLLSKAPMMNLCAAQRVNV